MSCRFCPGVPSTIICGEPECLTPICDDCVVACRKCIPQNCRNCSHFCPCCDQYKCINCNYLEECGCGCTVCGRCIGREDKCAACEY